MLCNIKLGLRPLTTVLVLSHSKGECHVTQRVYISERVPVAVFFSLAVLKEKEELRYYLDTILEGVLP